MKTRFLAAPLHVLDRASARLDGQFVVLLAWAVLIYPQIALRGFHYEEGLAVAIARGAIQEGYWIEPHVYGVRFVERPNLLAAMIAGLGLLLGSLHPAVVRIPTVCALLFGALLLYRFVERHGSRTAGLVAALCFLLSPMLLQKLVTAEPDLVLAVLLFWAFVIWWNGQHGAGPSLRRWLAIGAVLAAAALLKGPQPLAFFALGVGAFLLVERRWRQLPGLILAGVIAAIPTAAWYAAVFRPGDASEWARYMRVGTGNGIGTLLVEKLRFAAPLAAELLPGILAAVPLVIWRPLQHKGLVLALSLYAGAGILALLLWPSGVAPRYAMPALPAIAVLSGLAFDASRDRFPLAWAGILWMGAALAIYPLAAGWIAAPLAPSVSQSARIAAYAIDQAVRTSPGTIFGVFGRESNILAHVNAPIRLVPNAEALQQLPAESWVFADHAVVDGIASARPEILVIPYVSPATSDRDDRNFVLARIVQR